jgi:hypothetical protein
MTTRTIDLNRFKDAVGFTATFRQWGNRRKGNMAKVKTSEDPDQDKKTKERIRLTKELIAAKEYEAISSFMQDLRNNFIYTNTVPSFFKEGFQLTGLAGVDPIEKRMRRAQTELAVLVNNLCAVFPEKIKEAQDALGDQFNPMDYPDIDTLRGLYSINWNWISFTVPEGLPEELRKAEQDKLEKQFADAGEQILLALRSGFAELVSHAVERLSVPAGEKPKIFKDSLIGNIQEFINTFQQRNLMNDVELAKLVGRAQEILSANGGLTPQKLRNYATTKDETVKAFAEVKAELDKMIIEKPSRKFDLSPE